MILSLGSRFIAKGRGTLDGDEGGEGGGSGGWLRAAWRSSRMRASRAWVAARCLEAAARAMWSVAGCGAARQSGGRVGVHPRRLCRCVPLARVPRTAGEQG